MHGMLGVWGARRADLPAFVKTWWRPHAGLNTCVRGYDTDTGDFLECMQGCVLSQLAKERGGCLFVFWQKHTLAACDIRALHCQYICFWLT